MPDNQTKTHRILRPLLRHLWVEKEEGTDPALGQADGIVSRRADDGPRNLPERQERAAIVHRCPPRLVRRPSVLPGLPSSQLLPLPLLPSSKLKRLPPQTLRQGRLRPPLRLCIGGIERLPERLRRGSRGVERQTWDERLALPTSGEEVPGGGR